ncbi:threonine synthase [Rhodovibrio salinarum]|uniref:Threonine synthase n=1 Tax=Rhodovibrio salinarum TaxID=1087 RepID=A0A934QG01_9PROT|nr:threonine synthase [Rhodovibrio salinarum]MBK1696063.1 threonine synthase [Rhodovibrio salinarum]
MRYQSTRGDAPTLGFDDVLLTGLAPDGGLYLPDHWPQLDRDRLLGFAGRPYAEVAAEVMRPFMAGSAAVEAIDRLCREAYGRFARTGTCPLTQIDEGTWLLELFHGPTLAFKDVAMQLLGDLFDHVLAARGERITIVGATSGDTGSAAIEACRDRDNVDIVILHPKGRTSEVQRRQMTTVDAANVHNVAVEGTFDDCQALVKAMFADEDFRRDVGLAAVNSINFARILAQTVYYVTSAVALGAPDRPVSFAVPTGNFGNVFAGHAARKMGVPIEMLTVASNANDILTRFFETGRMETQGVVATHSPSMDIQVSSNFERLLYELMDGDGHAVAREMQQFKQTGAFALSQGQLGRARAGFDGFRLNDPGTLEEVARQYANTGLLIDPHSAIGLAAARARRPDPHVPTVALATAHPAKFPDAVAQATGQRPSLPDRLADLYDRPEHYTTLPNELARVETHVRAVSRRAGGDTAASRVGC